MPVDRMYHLGLDNKTHDLPKMFGDVKYVFLGGTGKRMLRFARMVEEGLNIKLPIGFELKNITESAHRYSMYKIGNVLSVSHGMGAPSLSILIHELIKLVQYAKCDDPVFIRLGTSGGLGLEPGTVVVSEKSVDGLLRPYHEIAILGNLYKCPSVFDADLVDKLVTIGNESFKNFSTIRATTMCTSDFYEGQGRLDGAFCSFNENDKFEFLHKIHSKGIRNIEMESLPFGAFCGSAGIKSATVCVTLVDRFKGDQIDDSQTSEFQDRPLNLVIEFLKSSS